ncbi:Ig-like domain-containing protein [Veronia pacifica]|uniref:Peptidase M66 domain-containing protein n=1 Tax=Veronia pacifica TaxID=1080227 RepID=A0A1C3EL62_9GAMM|nr:Ig-like domain-containing protein [Veronia pacifica]ODA33976.1 hypothetical protein A8L45_07970 [Veronia pacifica]
MKCIHPGKNLWLIFFIIFSFTGCFSGDDEGTTTRTSIDNDLKEKVEIKLNKSVIEIENEAGGESTLTVVLTSKPPGKVVLDVVSDNLNEVMVSSPQLTFSTTNWRKKQSVTLTAINDNKLGNGTANVKVSVNTNLSVLPSDLPVQKVVEVTIKDDDQADFLLSKTTMTIPESSGTWEFNTILMAQPKTNVIFDISSDDQAEAIVSPSQITFTPSNWDLPQPIVVQGVDDTHQSQDSVEIRVSVNNESDQDFMGMQSKSVMVILRDNDNKQPTEIAVDPSEPPGELVVTLDNHDHYFHLYKVSHRGPNFEVVRFGEDGSKEPITPGKVRTYTGYSPTAPDTVIAATLRPDGDLRYHLFRGASGDDEFGVPISTGEENDYDPNRETNVTYWDKMPPAPEHKTEPMGTLTPPSELRFYSADVSFFIHAPDYEQKGFKKVETIIEKAETSLNFTDVIYVRDIHMQHPIDKIVIHRGWPEDFVKGTHKRLNAIFPDNITKHFDNIKKSGGGLAGVCSNWSTSGMNKLGEFWHVYRHEVGHNHGSTHFVGGSPEGRSVMSGNHVKLSIISGPEQEKMQKCQKRRFKSYRDGVAPPHPYPPNARYDKVKIDKDTSEIEIDVLANDTDANGNNIAILDFDTQSKNGTIRFEPAADEASRDKLIYQVNKVFENGERDQFNYRIVDEHGYLGKGTVRIIDSAAVIDVDTQKKLNNIGANKDKMADIYKVFTQINFTTKDGHWVKFINLPSPVQEGRMFTLQVKSTASVRLRFNGKTRLFYKGQTVTGEFRNGKWELN